jgi:hypothetical protein
MISYIEGTANENYTAVHMDYDNDVFDYGDWGNVWFIKNLRPCMLNYDGTEAYLLDPNDYTKKADGTDSDISDSTFDGNVMVGIPKVYFKIVPIDDDHCNFYFSDKKVDDNYHCWAHINNYGDEIPYCYLSAYDGSLVDSKLRSISGLMPELRGINTLQEFIAPNNQNDDNIWSMNTYSDWLLIVLLGLLISKTTNSQTSFGLGHSNGSSTSNTYKGCINCGLANDKGLFWGTNVTGSPVKIFGIENFWGQYYRFMLGAIYSNGIQKIKLTYGTQDGSTVEGYNLTGNGYITIDDSTVSGTVSSYNSKYNSGYLLQLAFTEEGIFIKKMDESSDYKSLYYDTSSIYLNGGTYIMTSSNYYYNKNDISIVTLSGFISYDSQNISYIKCLPKVN